MSGAPGSRRGSCGDNLGSSALHLYGVCSCSFAVVFWFTENFSPRHTRVIIKSVMAFPIKVCVVCSEEFELKPDKPGFANRCPECSADDSTDPTTKRRMDADERKSASEANEARRQAMRDLLYRKDS